MIEALLSGKLAGKPERRTAKTGREFVTARLRVPLGADETVFVRLTAFSESACAALLAGLTGRDIRRRVRQHDGDTDLEGLPGWSLEIKRHAAAPRGEIARWWLQAVEQAQRAGQRPLLLYRPDRGAWRAVWAPDDDPAHAVEADPATWWRLTQPWHADHADSPT